MTIILKTNMLLSCSLFLSRRAAVPPLSSERDLRQFFYTQKDDNHTNPNILTVRYRAGTLHCFGKLVKAPLCLKGEPCTIFSSFKIPLPTNILIFPGKNRIFLLFSPYYPRIIIILLNLSII